MDHAQGLARRGPIAKPPSPPLPLLLPDSPLAVPANSDIPSFPPFPCSSPPFPPPASLPSPKVLTLVHHIYLQIVLV
jgi:hypothetical protein